MAESDRARELIARAEMHEKLAEATEDERARKMELALAAELRRKAEEADEGPDTPLHRMRDELKDKLKVDAGDPSAIRDTIDELNRVIDGAPRSS